MADKLGQEFLGMISGITEWGIYVEISENKVEGMVPVQTLMDDFYIFDEDNYCMRGRNTRKIYQLGDEVRVSVRSINLAKRQLDFTMTEMSDEKEKVRKRKK